MKIRKIVLLTLLFLFSTALAEDVKIIPTGTEALQYPQLQGMADEAVQEKINSDIVLSANVTDLMVKQFTLKNGDSLSLSYDVSLHTEEIFSVLLCQQGPTERGQKVQKWTALTYDLQTGERLTLDQLFEDANAAILQMEEIAEATLSEELSGYMEHSELLPLPVDSFTLDEMGITFWYSGEQFSFFSGFSGACQFWYEEIGLPGKAWTDAKTSIEEHVKAGQLPGIPVTMGENMQQVSETYRLLRTPDAFPGGRYFVMEDPQFRSVLVLSDTLHSDYANSVVEGIQLKRGGLCGLVIGKATQADWRKLLGEPEKTIAFTENMAYDYALPQGEYDVYHYGENELRLHADEEGVLCAIQLCK